MGFLLHEILVKLRMEPGEAAHYDEVVEECVSFATVLAGWIGSLAAMMLVLCM